MPQPQPSTGAWAVMGPARKVSLHMQGKSHQGRHGYMHESSQAYIYIYIYIYINYYIIDLHPMDIPSSDLVQNFSR